MTKREMKILDKEWSLKVKELAEFKCECCLTSGEYTRLESAHIVGRAYRTTRWGTWLGARYDLNGICLCFQCHQLYDQHIDKEKFIREVVIGLPRYDALLTTKRIIAKNQDFEKIREWIKNANNRPFHSLQVRHTVL
jgi:hypothetical protein